MKFSKTLLLTLLLTGCALPEAKQTPTPPPTPIGARPERGVTMDTGSGGATFFKANDGSSTPESAARFVQITDIKVLPHQANGRQMQRVWVKWRNIGSFPIASVSARIEPLTANGNVTIDAVDSYSIFNAGNDPTRFVMPGQEHSHPADGGFILIQGLSNGQDAFSARVTPVKATVGRISQ